MWFVAKPKISRTGKRNHVAIVGCFNWFCPNCQYGRLHCHLRHHHFYLQSMVTFPQALRFINNQFRTIIHTNRPSNDTVIDLPSPFSCSETKLSFRYWNFSSGCKLYQLLVVARMDSLADRFTLPFNELMCSEDLCSCDKL